MTAFVAHIRRQFSDARPAKRAGLILLALVAFTVVGTSAWAYWTTIGHGTASATTGTLNAPTDVSATSVPGSGSVQVGWTDSTLSNGTPAQGYYVTKTTGGTTTAACNSSDTTTVAGGSSALACDDPNVPPATYTYRVIAVFSGWTAASDPTAEVTVLAPQVVTWAPTTGILTTQSPLTPSALASALGGATISYSVINQTTTNCTVNASTGVLTYTGAGTCVVRATAAPTTTYAAGTLDVTFTVTVNGLVITAYNPNGVVGNGTFSGTGGTSGATVTVTVCKENTFPCTPSGQVVGTGTATVAANGSWTTTVITMGSKKTFYAQAVQTSPVASSASFTFVTP